MRPRVLQLLVTALFALCMLTGSAVSAQSDAWQVEPGSERRDELVARYTGLLLSDPDRPYILRSLLSTVGTGAALDRLIQSVRREVETRPRPAASILLGHLLAARGHADRALQAYRDATALGSESPAAFTALANALADAGRHEEAEGAYRRALELAGEGRARRKLLRKLVDRALATSDLPAAAGWYAELVAERPRDYDLRVEYAETLLRTRRFDDALGAYRSALELAGRSGKRRARLLVDIGSVHRQMEDPVSAMEAYRKALRLTGQSSWMRREILMKLVDVHRDVNRLPAIYDELLREWRRPSFHDSVVLANLAEELGRDDDAVRWLERAARLDRRAVEPRKRLLARMERDGNRERVEALYDELLRIRPDDLPQRLERIEWLYFRKKRVDRALEQLRDLEASRSDDPDSLAEIAATWTRFGVTDEAIRLHRSTLKAHPENVANIEAYGTLLARLGNREDAESVWTSLLDLDDSLRTRLRLAELTTRAGYHAWTIELLEQCVQEAPQLADVRQRLAAAYGRTRAWDDAVGEWETLFRDHGATHAARRIVSIAEHTWNDEILTRWEGAYRENPSPRVGIVVVELRDVFGHTAEAAELAKEIASVDPSTLAAEDRAAWIDAVDTTVEILEAVDSPQAVSLLVRLADAFGDQRVRAAQRMADIALTFSTEAAAPLVMKRAVETAPNDPYVHTQAGYFLSDRGDLEAAIEHLERAVALGPGDFDVHLDLVAYLTQLNRTERAREVLMMIVRGDWTGKWAAGAAFSALDLCETDAQLIDLEREVRQLRGRIPQETFHSIMVGIYGWLFVYADAPEAAFAKLGEVALDTLIGAIEVLDEVDRRRAVVLLRLYPDDEVGEAAVRRWASATSWNVHMIWTVARDRHGGAEQLLPALGSDDGAVRQMAIFALGTMKARLADEALAEIASDAAADVDDRILAAVSLGRLDTRTARETLAAVSASDDPERLRRAATWALGFDDSDRRAALVAARLDDENEFVRRVAAAALSRLDTDAGFRALLQAYWGTDAIRRAVAEHGLRLGPADVPTWPTVEADEALPEPEKFVNAALDDIPSVTATGSLSAAIAGRPHVVVDLARQRLREEPVRAVVLSDLLRAADEASGEELPTLRGIVASLRPELTEFASTRSTATFVGAAMLLPVAEHPDDIPVVVDAATRASDDESGRILERLSRYEWDDAREELVRALRSDRSIRRRASLRAIARVGAPTIETEAIDLIRRLVDDSDSSVRIAAIETLGALRHDDAADDLVEVFETADVPTRAAILGSLRAMDTPRASEAARQLLVVPIHRPCEGDQGDLTDLVSDACEGVFEVPDF